MKKIAFFVGIVVSSAIMVSCKGVFSNTGTFSNPGQYTSASSTPTTTMTHEVASEISGSDSPGGNLIEATIPPPVEIPPPPEPEIETPKPPLRVSVIPNSIHSQEGITAAAILQATDAQGEVTYEIVSGEAKIFRDTDGTTKVAAKTEDYAGPVIIRAKDTKGQFSETTLNISSKLIVSMNRETPILEAGCFPLDTLVMKVFRKRSDQSDGLTDGEQSITAEVLDESGATILSGDGLLPDGSYFSRMGDGFQFVAKSVGDLPVKYFIRFTTNRGESVKTGITALAFFRLHSLDFVDDQANTFHSITRRAYSQNKFSAVASFRGGLTPYLPDQYPNAKPQTSWAQDAIDSKFFRASIAPLTPEISTFGVGIRAHDAFGMEDDLQVSYRMSIMVYDVIMDGRFPAVISSSAGCTTIQGPEMYYAADIFNRMTIEKPELGTLSEANGVVSYCPKVQDAGSKAEQVFVVTDRWNFEYKKAVPQFGPISIGSAIEKNGFISITFTGLTNEVNALNIDSANFQVSDVNTKQLTGTMAIIGFENQSDTDSETDLTTRTVRFPQIQSNSVHSEYSNYSVSAKGTGIAASIPVPIISPLRNSWVDGFSQDVALDLDTNPSFKVSLASVGGKGPYTFQATPDCVGCTADQLTQKTVELSKKVSVETALNGNSGTVLVKVIDYSQGVKNFRFQMRLTDALGQTNTRDVIINSRFNISAINLGLESAQTTGELLNLYSTTAQGDNSGNEHPFAATLISSHYDMATQKVCSYGRSISAYGISSSKSILCGPSQWAPGLKASEISDQGITKIVLTASPYWDEKSTEFSVSLTEPGLHYKLRRIYDVPQIPGVTTPRRWIVTGYKLNPDDPNYYQDFVFFGEGTTVKYNLTGTFGACTQLQIADASDNYVLKCRPQFGGLQLIKLNRTLNSTPLAFTVQADDLNGSWASRVTQEGDQSVINTYKVAWSNTGPTLTLHGGGKLKDLAKTDLNLGSRYASVSRVSLLQNQVVVVAQLASSPQTDVYKNSADLVVLYIPVASPTIDNSRALRIGKKDEDETLFGEFLSTHESIGGTYPNAIRIPIRSSSGKFKVVNLVL